MYWILLCVAACGLKFERGPCRNYSVGWFYDTEYGGCSRFWYGGCEGNGNRFSSKEECEDTCVSPPPKGKNKTALLLLYFFIDSFALMKSKQNYLISDTKILS